MIVENYPFNFQFIWKKTNKQIFHTKLFDGLHYPYWVTTRNSVRYEKYTLSLNFPDTMLVDGHHSSIINIYAVRNYQISFSNALVDQRDGFAWVASSMTSVIKKKEN